MDASHTRSSAPDIDPSLNPGAERLRLTERRHFAAEAQLPRAVHPLQRVDGLAPEDFGQRTHRKEEAVAAGRPPRRIGRECAAGDDAVHMGGLGERLLPGMQHRQYADLAPQVPPAELQQRS